MNTKTTLAKRLDPIRRLAQNREDDAAKRFAESQIALQRQEAQLQEMERYMNEYGGGAPGASLVPALLANRTAFLRQLAEALRWQAGAVQEARTQLERARAQWVDKHHDTDVLETLMVRSAQSEQRSQERRLQREMDEFAQRRPPSALAG
jgi:flagellar FliJ protein